MKVKQLTLKAFEFEIDDKEAFFEYFTKNAPLIQGYQLILKGSVDADIKAFLDEKGAVYIDTTHQSIITRKKRSTAVLDEVEEKSSIQKEAVAFYRPIRSGESIESTHNLSFFARINSGAMISTTGSLEVFGIIDGVIHCGGAHIVLKEIGKGSVFFNGEELDATQLDGRLKLIRYEKDTITYEDI